MSDEAYVAFHGNVYMKNAMDSHKTAMRIQVMLEHDEDYKVFKGFNKHRKGKTGTGMYQAMSKAQDQKKWYGPIDLWFLGWTMSSRNGTVITFQIEDEREWRKMREISKALDQGYTVDQLDPTEFMLVELDQEGKPINVKQRAKLEKMALKRTFPKGGSQSKRAARLCQDLDFRSWVTWKEYGPEPSPGAAISLLDVDKVADWMRKECDIVTRAQLDHDPAALQRFEDRVMKPFLRSTL